MRRPSITFGMALMGMTLLSGCGADGIETMPVAMPKQPAAGEAECQASTERIVRAVGGLRVDEKLDGATVGQIVGNGSPDCIGYDKAALDRIYATAATTVVGELRSRPTPSSSAPAPATPEETCRAAFRKVLTAVQAAKKRGEDPAAAEEEALREVEGDKPCDGVSDATERRIYQQVQDEVAGGR